MMKQKTLDNKINGFTIVELLIVIVVIAILAAISIVAYNGIQVRANNSSAATTAENVAKKVEAFNSVTGAYPTNNATSSITTQLSGQTESTLTGTNITLSATTPTGDLRRTTAKVQLCFASATPAAGTAARGYKVFRYDFTTNAWQTNPDQFGGDFSANCFETTQNVSQ